jgi:hypothetical protein
LRSTERRKKTSNTGEHRMKRTILSNWKT